MAALSGATAVEAQSLGPASSSASVTRGPSPIHPNRQRYERQKLGLFVHYVPALTVDATGATPDIDALARGFDAPQFADDAAAFGVEYVIFTAWHLNARTLYPSAVNKRWRDDRRTPGKGDAKTVKTYGDDDLIDRLATELARKGIDLHLYVHPVDGHDFSAEGQEITGWNDCSNDHETWNRFQNEFFDELVKRYRGRIAGLWFDGKWGHTNKEPKHDAIQQDRLRKTLLAHDPGLVLMANVSLTRDGNPFPGWSAADYCSWEVGTITERRLGLGSVNPDVKREDVLTWPGTKQQIAMIVGGSWWAARPRATAKSPAEDLFRYLVLQASVSRSGGFAVAAGNFPGRAIENGGNIWEGNVHETLVALNRLVSPVAASIKNTHAGTAYVTADHQWLDQMPWGVSTESPDRKTVYLHVVKPPAGQTLTIGQTADGSTLGGRAVLLKTGARVSFKTTSAGFEITLPNGVAWDPLDTVIVVGRQ
jgi:hypothetical protein